MAEVTPTQLQKAFLTTEGGDRIECMFNPAKFSFKMANTWKPNETPGKNVPTQTFAGGQSGSFSLSLTFDTTDVGTTVTTHTNKLLKLMDVDTSLSSYDATRNSGRPPWVTFNWGTNIHTFKAIVSSLDIAFTYFSNEGLPLRATADMQLTQFEPDDNWTRQNPTSGTPVPRRTHRISPGETLDRISAKYYGDSTQWRALAQANGIGDPLDLTPGRLIAIPERAELQ
jgi:Contractile injection system tube protein/LysM domain